MTQKTILTAFAVFTFFLTANAQQDTIFWFVAPETAQASNNLDRPVAFRFSTYDSPATVKVSQPANSAFPVQTISIASNASGILEFPPLFDAVENMPPNTVLNKGFLIQATSPITAYYEILGETPNNPEIFSLKGKNALGTRFFLPFQNILDNSGSYFPTPHAAFEIVATENNTKVTIMPAKDIVGHAANVPFMITLNRGQTYSAQAVSQLSSQHPAGSRVVSDKPIAVTVKDDLLEGGQIVGGFCRDVIGDQIVPVEKVGTKYVVQKGFLNSDERVFVLATAPGTQVSFDGVLQGTVNSGETLEIIVGAGSHFLETSAPAYAFQLTGTDCELAAATLPALDCSGSSSVRFVRTSNEDFYLYLVTKNGNQGGFTLNGNGSLLPAGSFQTVPGSNGEFVAAVFPFSNFQVQTGQSSVVNNSLGTFQMAFLNGGDITGCRFGYFSDFCKESVISDIVNDYTPVFGFSGCDSTLLEAGPLAGFAAGDKVLLIQMKGATVDLSNTPNFGNITDAGNAGNYEFNRIRDISGNQVQLLYKLTRPYDVAGKVQLIRVPEYDDFTTDGLTCKAWDGETGGVLAFDVANTLTLLGDLDVSGKGFRGGKVVDTDDASSHETGNFYPPDPALAAEKGEGIAIIPLSQSYGRGKSANGGGGGNAHNAGGGGGGNAGAGGNGGLEYFNTPGAPTPGTDGVGGLTIFGFDVQKIALGGGGGAGHTNDEVGTSGGNGGGIILVKAGTVNANGFRMLANGEDVIAGGTNRNDGQGGGGAGGTILFDASQVVDNLSFELKGGRGGDCLFFVNSQIIGPGGGGGGGKLALSQLFPTISLNLNGGVNGIANQNMTNGAQPGQAGSVLFPLGTLPAGADTVSLPTVHYDIGLCPGDTVVIDGIAYTQPATVTDTIPGQAGCDTVATYTIHVINIPVLDLGPDIILCVDSTVTFDAGPGFVEYLWQDGSTDQTFTASDVGIYWVEVADSCGNTQRDSVFFTVSLLPDTQFPDTVLCAGDSIHLFLPGFDTYVWAPAAGLSCTDCADVALFPAVTTTYTLLATTADGCVLTDTFAVDVLPLPTFTETITFCPGESVALGGTTYTQPATVTLALPSATGGCDTLATYVLEYATPAPSVVTIKCPSDVDIGISPGAGDVVVDYDLPVFSTDCPCPGVALELTEGMPSGSAFPPGLTLVCYEARDSCGNTTSCCFEVMIREEQPCDIKKNGCMKYELLSITKDASSKKTYRIRATNSCNNPLTYIAIQLPNSMTAKKPLNNTIYTAPGGREYLVRNPNYSPFYSIRFKSTTDSISNGESDIFEYTLPAQADPAFIHITARLEPQVYYEAHLNTFYCPVETTPDPNKASAAQGLKLFPNPTSGDLFVDLSQWQGEQVQAQVFDSRGQRVTSLALTADAAPQPVLLPETLADGLYFFEILTQGGEKQSLRFVLMR